jgi:hypothetical protein
VQWSQASPGLYFIYRYEVLYRYALHNDIGKVCCMGMHYIMILVMFVI